MATTEQNIINIEHLIGMNRSNENMNRKPETIPPEIVFNRYPHMVEVLRLAGRNALILRPEMSDALSNTIKFAEEIGAITTKTIFYIRFYDDGIRLILTEYGSALIKYYKDRFGDIAEFKPKPKTENDLDLLSVETVDRIIQIARSVADKRANNAAHNGEHHDGGKRDILEACRIMNSLWQREPIGADALPKELQEFVGQAKASLDPEYETYLRLKKKFDRGQK